MFFCVFPFNANHAELMARQGYYARMFELQAAGYAAEELPLEMADGA